MSGKTSAAAKNKYYAANYDSIRVFVPKGQKDIIRIKIKDTDANISMNEFICRATYNALGLDYDEAINKHKE